MEMLESSSKEAERLRRQLERSKESRKLMAEQHDEAVVRLERAKEVSLAPFVVESTSFCLLAAFHLHAHTSRAKGVIAAACSRDWRTLSPTLYPKSCETAIAPHS